MLEPFNNSLFTVPQVYIYCRICIPLPTNIFCSMKLKFIHSLIETRFFNLKAMNIQYNSWQNLKIKKKYSSILKWKSSKDNFLLLGLILWKAPHAHKYHLRALSPSQYQVIIELLKQRALQAAPTQYPWREAVVHKACLTTGLPRALDSPADLSGFSIIPQRLCGWATPGLPILILDSSC